MDRAVVLGDNLIPQWFEQSTQEFFTATAEQDGDPRGKR
jgi:hypothetical protein